MKHNRLFHSSYSIKPATALVHVLVASVLTGAVTEAAQAKKYPVTAQQRRVARAAAASGVPVSALIPNAPSKYVVKRGDTLWDISKKFLKNAWRWPELWGMNLRQIRNPHLIYPGQILWLEIKNGRARLRMARKISGGGTVNVSPRVRVEERHKAIPTIPPQLIEPFLSEPIIVDEMTLKQANWIVASRTGRVLLGTGDRVYARGQTNNTLQYKENADNIYRIFRNAVPIKDPVTQEVLGYEGKFIGRARLVRSETVSTDADGGTAGVPEAATLEIIYAKEGINIGDRLLPEPETVPRSHVPHAPLKQIKGLVASVYGDAVTYAGQNQIVAINKGTKDGITHGDVLELVSTGKRIVDKHDMTVGSRKKIKLPDERNGLLYIFRPFERISYGLVVEVENPVVVGDRVENPMMTTFETDTPGAVAEPASGSDNAPTLHRVQ